MRAILLIAPKYCTNRTMFNVLIKETKILKISQINNYLKLNIKGVISEDLF